MAKSVEVKVNLNLNFDMADISKNIDLAQAFRNAIAAANNAVSTLAEPDSAPAPDSKSDSPEIKLGETTYSRPRFSSTHEARVDAYRRISTVISVIDVVRRGKTHKTFCEGSAYIQKLDDILADIKSILLSPDYKSEETILSEGLDKPGQ